MTAPAISLVDAMSSPLSFEPWFHGESWNGWHTVLKGVYGLPMTEAERAFFRTVADRDPPKQPVREAWFVCGRGAGKDSVASVIVAHSAALFDSSRLRGGERAMVACLACDREQARIVLDYCRSYFTEIEALKGMVTRETATGFELSNLVDIAVSTNWVEDENAGRSLLAVVFDECAFWRDEKFRGA